MIVDVHCHMFNADDLPVEGFVRHVEKLDWIVGRGLARILDRYVQEWAPDASRDLARLEALLDGAEIAVDSSIPDLAEIEARIDAVLAADPELAAEVQQDLATSDGLDIEAIGLSDIRRAVRWAALFALSRVDLPGRYAERTGKDVDLAVPMLVDLDEGVDDSAISTPAEQLSLFDHLSRVSMLDRLPGVSGLALHPFIAFDPLRQLAHSGSGASPLAHVQRAVEAHGFIGVKVYPPMGWRPSGNTQRQDTELETAQKLDAIVLEFAEWCAAEDVPVTTHCNDSQYADPTFKGFGSPADWRGLLENDRCEGLHVNLGHFGGIHDSYGDYGWTRDIAALMDDVPTVFADVSCHDLSSERSLGLHRRVLQELVDAGRPILSRVMFGTDWYMQAINRKHDEFLQDYRTFWAELFGSTAADRFMADNALRFLGFDDPDNKNTVRLTERYDAVGVARPGWLGGPLPA